jgi:hypothetical protein
MSNPRVKIPVFDKINYGLWKKKMILFIQVANPKYLEILKTGPIIPMIIEEEVTMDGTVVIPENKYPKDVSAFTDDDKKDVALDSHL